MLDGVVIVSPQVLMGNGRRGRQGGPDVVEVHPLDV
jgi:hypothetical protein